MTLEKEFEKTDITKYKTHKQYKTLFRDQVPDSKRRDLILQFFGLNPMMCQSRYDTIVKEQGEEFIDHTKKAQLFQKQLQYKILSDQGLDEFEVILAIIFKNKQITHSPIMASVAHLLLIFMNPAEVYHVLDGLMKTSIEAFKTVEEQSLIRWHLTYEQHQYFRLLNLFIKSYLNTTVRKKRSLLNHFKKISFDFTYYVDQSIKSAGQAFVPLSIAFDILMMYLAEGVKILCRFSYAVLKVNKGFIKKCMDPKTLLQSLQQNGRSSIDCKKLQKAAFKYKLTRKSYNFKKANVDKMIDPKTGQSQFTTEDDFFDYVPQCEIKSAIITYQEFSKLWKFLPDYIKIRIPEILFQSSTDGYNLQSLYRKLEPFKNEYKFCLILIQTKQNQVFGAFIDDVLRKRPNNYLGSADSFVFTIRPQLNCYYSSGQNEKHFLGELEYFTIGGEGDGPAIWVNETLSRGQTNQCKTYMNQLLTLGEKVKDDQYDIHNFELILV